MPKFNFCPQCASVLEVVSMHNRHRLTCSARCGFVHWDNPIPVVLKQWLEKRKEG